MRYIMFGYNELPDDKLDREYFYYDNEEMKVLRLRYRLEVNYNLIFAMILVGGFVVSSFRDQIVGFGQNMNIWSIILLLAVVCFSGAIFGILFAKRDIDRMETSAVQITSEELRESYGIDTVEKMARIGKIFTIVLPLIEIMFIIIALNDLHLLLVPVLVCPILQFAIVYNWYLGNPWTLIEKYNEAMKE